MSWLQFSLAILLFISIALNRLEASCPNHEAIKPCTCDDEGLQCIKLDDAGLSRVFRAPAEHKAIRRVWIFQTNITVLPMNAFGDYIIRDLFLDLNHISHVEPGAFGAASKTLQSLSLTRNSLSLFPFNDLKEMKKIKQLGLGHNRLIVVPSYAFPSSETLEFIDLSHNSIKKVEPYAFTTLQELSLIDLSRNELEELLPNSFNVQSTKQLMISLRGNKISKIAANAFSEHTIGSIDLARNQLTYLDEIVFSPLLVNGTMIDVEDNQFTCNSCETYKWLVQINRDHLSNLVNFVCADDTKLEDLTLESIGCAVDDIYN